LTSGDFISTIRQEFKGEREDLIPILQRVQGQDGYLRPDAIRSISRWLKISENEIFGVATFYAQFRFHPPGEHHIKICLGTACHVRGGEQILSLAQTRLNIKPARRPPTGSTISTAWLVWVAALWLPWSPSTTSSIVKCRS